MTIVSVQRYSREEGRVSGFHQSQSSCFAALIDLLVQLQSEPGTPPLLQQGPFMSRSSPALPSLSPSLTWAGGRGRQRIWALGPPAVGSLLNFAGSVSLIFLIYKTSVTMSTSQGLVRV